MVETSQGWARRFSATQRRARLVAGRSGSRLVEPGAVQLILAADAANADHRVSVELSDPMRDVPRLAEAPVWTRSGTVTWSPEPGERGGDDG
ncbi:hypothetical protein [Herbiconiux ginsengi]|uniref:Uncharacterized protein n=1 Tax=Herbiconiux ginsengi TaxID=381665 RepID=A0A1H3MLB8_9MICO|nr:hypothetical protein [Herbiconiux ginsengi]SDY77501.1 hypothetical protein SAMN05216554_1475 [Herbiconiux ginsengi]